MQVPILEFTEFMVLFNIVAKSRTIRLFLVAGRQTRPDRKKNIFQTQIVREGRVDRNICIEVVVLLSRKASHEN